MNAGRHELAAALHRAARVAAAAEQPVLRAHGLSMWEYVVLNGLDDGPVHTQARLAAAVGRDPTRLIPILDELEARGLVRRHPDPADRRNKIVELRPAGRDLLRRCRAGVRAAEEELLSDLGEEEQTVFRRVLAHLADD